MRHLFIYPAFVYLFSFRCVVLLRFLFSIDLNAQVSDTTGDK